MAVCVGHFPRTKSRVRKGISSGNALGHTNVASTQTLVAVRTVVMGVNCRR